MPAQAAPRAQRAVVNAAGLVQGIALVTFPAASTIFTSPGSCDLSRGQYGIMFAPQMITPSRPRCSAPGSRSGRS
jgi:hypothetical protein